MNLPCVVQYPAAFPVPSKDQATLSLWIVVLVVVLVARGLDPQQAVLIAGTATIAAHKTGVLPAHAVRPNRR